MAKTKRRGKPADLRKQELLAEAEQQEQFAANCRAPHYTPEQKRLYADMARQADQRAVSLRQQAAQL